MNFILTAFVFLSLLAILGFVGLSISQFIDQRQAYRNTWRDKAAMAVRGFFFL